MVFVACILLVSMGFPNKHRFSLEQQRWSAVRSFARKLKKLFGLRIKHVYVYGSFVHGRFSSESDVDFAIIVRKRSDVLNKQIHDLAFDFVSLKLQRFASVLLVEEKRFNEWINTNYPFALNVVKGVELV